MSDIKLCKDYRWFSEIPDKPWWAPTCTNDKTRTIDYVRGRHTDPLCVNARFNPLCGPEGKLWEPRE